MELRTAYEGCREGSDLRWRAGRGRLGVRVVGGVPRSVALLSKAGRLHTDTEKGGSSTGRGIAALESIGGRFDALRSGRRREGVVDVVWNPLVVSKANTGRRVVGLIRHLSAEDRKYRGGRSRRRRGRCSPRQVDRGDTSKLSVDCDGVLRVELLKGRLRQVATKSK